MIVLKVLSSFFQNLRDGGKQPSPSGRPVRPRPARPPFFPDIFDIPPDVQADPEEAQETETSRGAVPDLPVQPLFPRRETAAEQARSFSPAPAVRRRRAVAPRAERQQKTARSRQKSELARLLKGENLALGLVALEVLSPPRARRSFYAPRAGK